MQKMRFDQCRNKPENVNELTKTTDICTLHRVVNEFISKETNVVSDTRLQEFSYLDRLLKHRILPSDQSSLPSSHFEKSACSFLIARLHEKCQYTYHKQTDAKEDNRVEIYLHHYLEALKHRDRVEYVDLSTLALLDHSIYLMSGKTLLNHRSKWITLPDIPNSLYSYLKLEKRHDDYAKQKRNEYRSSLATPLTRLGKAVGAAAGIYLTGGLSFSVATLFGGALGFYAGNKAGEQIAEGLTEKCHRKTLNPCRD